MNIAPKRELPKLYKITLRNWYKKNYASLEGTNSLGKVYLFADEISNYNDVTIGITSIKLLKKLGYEVIIPKHEESGRPALSKGILDYAKKVATTNVTVLHDLISEETPLLGIEPSAILTFRDEYPRLVDQSLTAHAKKLAKSTLLIDEFLAQEIKKGKISSSLFTEKPQQVLLHGHCIQKALSSVDVSKELLSLPKNYEVEVIPSGCCGMSGSFGYDKDKYDVSMQIGELVLFPKIREAKPNTIIAAPGTSCRHQIKDGTNEVALHPVDVLWNALK